MWWRGPSCLSRPENEWLNSEISETAQSNEERKLVNVTVAGVTKKSGVTQALDVNNFRKYRRLLRVTAWVERFEFNLRSRRNDQQRKTCTLHRDEVAAAENTWTAACQEELKNHKSYQELAYKLKLEERGRILRCRGRLENSDLDVESQQPIILAKDHKVTKLLIEECHKRVHHGEYGGVKATLGELRSRFWVPKGPQVVKRVLRARECVTCKREQGKPFIWRVTLLAESILPSVYMRQNLTPLPESKMALQ